MILEILNMPQLSVGDAVYLSNGTYSKYNDLLRYSRRCQHCFRFVARISPVCLNCNSTDIGYDKCGIVIGTFLQNGHNSYVLIQC